MDKDNIAPKSSSIDIRFEKPTFIDPLTGLFNRYYLYEFLPQEIRKAQASNYSLGIFMLDMDNFKEINDKHGHLFGDEVLRQFSERLKKGRRQTDMVIRYAGDEFIILLPGVDRQAGVALGKHLIEEISKFAFTNKNKAELHLTASIGFSLFPNDATEVDKLIDAADKALYLSKERGRNQVSCADEVTLATAAYRIAVDYFPCPKFVDRYEEMLKLKGTFDDIVLSQKALEAVFICGDSGVGRSRMLSEFSDYANAKAVILSSKGLFKNQQEPYYLFASALDGYINRLGANSLKVKELFSALSSEELAELARLLPRLSKAPAPGASGKQARSLLFKALLDLLVAMNRDSALVIAFDDAQWADRASLELINYLIKYERKRKIFIVLTFEDKPDEQGSAIKKLLDYLGESENAAQIKLFNLNQRDTYGMIEGMFPGIKEIKELNNLVFDITKGNPAFIEEIFKSLAENRFIVYRDNAWRLDCDVGEINIPHSLSETTRKRLRTLDKETKDLILQAAVIGNNFSVDTLNKLADKNEGYIFDIISRAQKMYLVKEEASRGRFNFVNQGIQEILYNEVDDAGRKAMHQKIGKIIEQDHAQDLGQAASELSFHFGRVAKDAVSAKYTALIQEKANTLFNPAEIIDYLKEISLEAAEAQDAKFNLSHVALGEAKRVIRLLQSAVKSFQLYPPGSSIRQASVNDLSKSLTIILAETPKLKIIESEGVLIVNNRRFSARETHELGAGELISLMIEVDVNSVVFSQGITEAELDVFVENLSCGRAAITKRGGWAHIVSEGKFAHIKIDEFTYQQIDAHKTAMPGELKRFEDAMMMEFLLGKLDQETIDKKAFASKVIQEPQKFAAAINKMAGTAGEGSRQQEEIKSLAEGIKKINSQLSGEESVGASSTDELSKIILELDWRLRNKFIRLRPEIAGVDNRNITEDIIYNLPQEAIINLIEESCANGLDNLLALRDLLDKAAPDKAKKKKITPLVEEKLALRGLDKEAIDYITGKLSWDKLLLEKRLKIFTELPSEELEMLDADLCAKFLEELLEKNRGGDIQKLISGLLSKTPNAEPKTREKISGLINNFIHKGAGISERIHPVLEILRTSSERAVFGEALNQIMTVLKDLTGALNPEKLYTELQGPQVKAHGLIIGEAFAALSERMFSPGAQDHAIQESIRIFIAEALKLPHFAQLLTFILLGYFHASAPRVKEILMLLGESAYGALISVCLNTKELAGESFEAYVAKRRISGVLKEMGEPALDKLKEGLLREKNTENILVLLELAANIADARLVEAVKQFTYQHDLELRRKAVLALSAIGTGEAQNVLSDLAGSEKNKQLQALIKKILAHRH